MEYYLSNYSEVRECDFKGRHYSVRDNGAIMRHPKEGCRALKLDNVWTFGNKDDKTGYMFYGGVRVHQIVATAFHGAPEDPNMVVDHNNTNRCDNRPENLKWVTRLENALNNPITRKRIILSCGSLEAFLKNPQILRETASEPNTRWMRTVSKEESAKCRKNLERWAKEDEISETPNEITNGIGEWIFYDNVKGTNDTLKPWNTDWETQNYKPISQTRRIQLEQEEKQYNESRFALKQSLTPGALQLNWATPTEFPCCPTTLSDKPLDDYLANLTEGSLFCHNGLYESKVLKAEISTNGEHISVQTATSGATNYALTEISFADGAFIHKSIRTFFTEDGVNKYFTESLGKKWDGGDVLEDYC